MFEALRRLGVPEDATVLEPGCGSGNFLELAPEGMHFIGVELDSLSGRIARALFPGHDIRIENFRDTRLPEGGVDAVIGNPPFADVKLEHRGTRFSLHDFFFAKSLDALRPGRHPRPRDHALHARQAERRGARVPRGPGRLPRGDSPAVGRLRPRGDEGRDRHRVPEEDEPPASRRATSIRAGWRSRRSPSRAWRSPSIGISTATPRWCSARWSRKDRLYGGEQGFSVASTGALEDGAPVPPWAGCRSWATRTARTRPERQAPAFTPPPLERHVTEGSFFIGDDRTIYQMVDGRAEPVTYGGTLLKTNGTMTGKRLAALIRIRDAARLVLQSQNEGWPEAHREEARRELNRLYDVFVSQYGLINKTTFSRVAGRARSSSGCRTS